MKLRATLAAIVALACATSAWSGPVARIGSAEYQSLDEALAAATDGSIVELLTNATLTNSANIVANVTIAGTNQFNIEVKKKNVWAIAEGGVLALSNCTVKAAGVRSTNHFFTVGRDSSLILEDGAAITGVSLPAVAIPVYVESGGTFRMEEGSTITNCERSAWAESTQGGAVHIASGGKFEFLGGTISGCEAYSGGAVYAEPNATLRVSGTATAYGNTAKGDSNDGPGNDLYLAATNILQLGGALTGGSIGVYVSGGASTNDIFGVVSEGVSADSVTLGKFVNDKDSNLVAVRSGDDLVWNTCSDNISESDRVVKLTVGGSTTYYASIEDGFAAATSGTATLTLLKDAPLSRTVYASTAMSFNGGGYTITRTGGLEAAIAVTNVELSVTNVTFYGGDWKAFDVKGTGSLTLDSGAVIDGVCSSDQKFVAPVVVQGNGTFTMNSGSAIRNCTNSYVHVDGGPLIAGAASVSGRAKAVLAGGTIEGCASTLAGGVYVGENARLEVSGGTTVWGNRMLTIASGSILAAMNCNLLVYNTNGLSLTSTLSGKVVGCTEGADMGGKFGTTSLGASAAGAAHFINDTNGAKGDVSGTYLVWGAADSSYVPGETYTGGGSSGGTVTVNPEEPLLFKSIEEANGSWTLTLEPGTGYCTYTVYTSDDPAAAKSTWTSVTNVTPTADGPITVTVDGSSAKGFWYATGAPGEKTAE